MKVLIVGAAAREHALAWSLKQSPQVSEVLIAPGNPGTARVGRNFPEVKANDVEGLLTLARREAVDLTLVGPESPLVEGLADRFREAGLAVFGPSKAAARLEGSKIFSKEFMARHNIPSASFSMFDDAAAAHRKVDALTAPMVLKADGLAAGKGVVVAMSREEAHAAIEQIMEKRVFGASGDRLVIEEFMAGEEASLFVVSDGERHLPFMAAQDHKRVFDGDRGPNTGGMGAYAPANLLSEAQLDEVGRTVIGPTLRELSRRGTPFRGALYAGLMLTPQGPRVLEFNARLGDPETQVLMMQLDEDLAVLIRDCARGQLEPRALRSTAGASVGVVLAAEGYPDSPRTGDAIALPAVPEGHVIFHAGTQQVGGELRTAGGRVLTVCARGATVAEARAKANALAEQVTWKGRHFRRDIGAGAP